MEYKDNVTPIWKSKGVCEFIAIRSGVSWGYTDIGLYIIGLTQKECQEWRIM